MQDQLCEGSPEISGVEVYEAPGRELLAQIAVFQDEEASWNSTVFDLFAIGGTFAIVRDPDDDIIGVASINELSPHNYWLGNVVVARRARRRGIASRMVSALLNCAETEKARPNVVLIASKPGEGIYRRLGFDTVETIKVVFYERPALAPPNRSTSCPIVPNEREHEDAIRLDQEANGVFRGQMLRDLFNEHRRCAILKSGSSVVAAAWARYMELSARQNRPELHIGPVVAKSPDFAVSVVAELLRMDHATSASERHKSGEASTALVLAVQHGNNEASKLVFESLGFVEKAEVPYMQKSLTMAADAADSSRSVLDLVTASECYYAMTWWDIA